MNAFTPIMQRKLNGETAFLNTLQMLSGCSKAEALKVLHVYRKFRLVNVDAFSGVISVKHGAFLEVDVIKKAIELK